jgi:hypothetical protein
MTTPAPPFVGISLLSVSCPSASDSVAVGVYSSGGTVVERWNGSNWALVASPDRTNTVSALLGVSCTSATNCLAVGNAETNLYRFSLVERFG